jgi:hypothetical protein
MFNLKSCCTLFNSRNNKKNDDLKKDHIILDKEFENNECIICLECMYVNEKIKILDCGHMYHYDCINNWILKKGGINCPICSK